jgi:hypothetical protein
MFENQQAETMETNTPKEFFEKALPARFKPEKAAGINVITQLNVTGPEGGNWTVILKDQKIQVTEGTHAAHINVKNERERFHGYG